ncbi:glycosyl transferase family 2 [Echinicola pacifica]|uniref:Glycosyl transferase family 2 n=1 Tax=Echinicola pacifica TaxID=346377 RepID=A0A918PZD8_9BACT|nr:glycosyl transferase family 2 [Echinicola pacifica]
MLVVFGKLSYFRQNNTDQPDQQLEGVSIIIAARNEARNLEVLIPLLAQQNYEAFEILVINDRSFDGTREVLAQLMIQYPQLRTVTIDYTPAHVTPKKYALTLGIKVAKYDVLVLTDADCLPATQDWVKLLTRPIRMQGKVFALGYGAYHKEKGFINALIRYETWFTAIQYFSFALWKAPFMGIGRNLAYRRQYFMDQKAFKGLWHILGGDDDLYVNRHASRKNTAVVIDPRSITYSTPKKKFNDYFLQKQRHYQAGRHYKAGAKIKIGIYALSHLFFWATALVLICNIKAWELILLITVIILARAVLQWSTFNQAVEKLEGKQKVMWTMFFDLMYLSYFWVIGAKGYLSKTVRWK